jgi:hypothetical protein
MTQCKPCRAGTFSNKQGASSAEQCDPCPKGTFALQTDIGATSDSVCISCPLGTYLTALNASSNSTCTKCKAGNFSISLFCCLFVRTEMCFQFVQDFIQRPQGQRPMLHVFHAYLVHILGQMDLTCALHAPLELTAVSWVVAQAHYPTAFRVPMEQPP